MNNDLEKTYEPQKIEHRWYQFWESHHFFAPQGKGESYSMMLPPPNVTGNLHMGHGFGDTLMDILIRYQRMNGKNTLWQMGMDHAGIATQMVVERQLNQQNKTRHDLGREKFVEKVWQWKNESGGNIARQLRRLGTSLDWHNERFTLDPSISHAVREVFIRLYDEGLIYRGERLVNWDPVLLTAISDLEVVNQETTGKLYYIRYKVEGNKSTVTVATTRPETLFGDVAVAVHPEDERYQQLIGKRLKLPLTTRTIPIIADIHVDPTFGTGCVKITPAHDFNDYVVGTRHNLIPFNIFTPNAHLNENVPEDYRGLERFAARSQVIIDLEKSNLLEKVDTTHAMKIPRGEKSGAIVEPYLTSQWFMKMKPLAEPAIDAVARGDIRFIPENWTKTYFQWMENIEDWCISRQLWWGHRIPVWYDAEGKTYVGHDEADVRAKHQLSPLTTLQQDEDVLDTWFSSALWPFVTLGWPEKTKTLETFYPTSILITGFDIIFFWVARMIMMGLKFTGQVPFRDVYLTGLIRDAEGQKMSKSKGNVLDPIDLIDGISLPDLITKRTYGLMQPKMTQKIIKHTEKEFPDGIPSYGTDALRFTFCAVASYTREIRFDTHRLAGYRNFCNKLWNASRYVLMNTVDQDLGTNESAREFSSVDRWILARLNQTIADAHAALALYRFDLFAHSLYEFTWNEYCDWYLELSKPVLTNENSNPSALCGTRYTLIHVLETLLRLLHPIIPFITEEIWQRLAPLIGERSSPSIMLAPYPEVDHTAAIDNTALTKIEWLKKLIVSIRTLRSEMNIAPGKQIPLLLRRGSEEEKTNLKLHQLLLISLAKIATISWLEDDVAPPPAASAFVGELEIYLPLAGFIDKEEESKRIQREIMKVEKEIKYIHGKLNNPQFVDRAPDEVVQKEKVRAKDLAALLIKYQQQLTDLQNL